MPLPGIHDFNLLQAGFPTRTASGMTKTDFCKSLYHPGFASVNEIFQRFRIAGGYEEMVVFRACLSHAFASLGRADLTKPQA
jgi:hypothetical protein